MSKVQFNRVPTYSLSLENKGKTNNAWFSFWAGLGTGAPTGEITPQTVGPSPAILVAPAGGSYIVQGGTTSQIRLSRDAQTFYVTGQVSGMIPVSQGDQIEISYTVSPPQVQFVPR